MFLLKQGIRLLYGRVRHPQTQGKVERFHRTLGERLRWWGVPTHLRGFARAFATFREEYNEVRPHEALADAAAGLAVCAEWSRLSAPTPRAGSIRRAVTSTASMPTAWSSYRGAPILHLARLGRRRGRVHAIARRVLVTYRQMYVRELHLRTGRSVALLQADA